MINLREVEDAIRELQSSSATYNNCMKLASLYIVRDELKNRQGGQYTYGYYPYYERGGNSSSGRSSNSSYGYRPMMYHNDDELMIHRDGMMDERR